jgi:hypothetical protein
VRFNLPSLECRLPQQRLVRSLPLEQKFQSPFNCGWGSGGTGAVGAAGAAVSQQLSPLRATCRSTLVSSALILFPNGEKKHAAWNLKKCFLGLDLPAHPVVVSSEEAEEMPGLGAGDGAGRGAKRSSRRVLCARAGWMQSTISASSIKLGCHCNPAFD